MAKSVPRVTFMVVAVALKGLSTATRLPESSVNSR